MGAYYSDGRGRYGTGESYDVFYMYEDESKIFTSEDGVWTYTTVEEGITLLRYNEDSINIIVPSVVDGKKVVSLDDTFNGFLELKSVVIPDGVTSIASAFHGCEALENVSLPDSIIDLNYAFSCCFSLKNINIPTSAQYFSYAFECTQFERFTFPQGTEDITSVFSDSEYLKYVFIPQNVKYSNEAFADCEKLVEVEIEDGVTRLDDWAFYHCLSLLELTIPESVKEFGKKSVGFMQLREYTNPQKTGYMMRGDQVIPGFKIKGVLGSAAEEYAKENGIEFIPLTKV